MSRPGCRVAWVLVVVCAACAFAQDPLAEARRLKQAGDLAGAERLLLPLVSAEPDNLAAQHLLAWVLLGEGRRTDAVAPLRAVVRLAPDSEQAGLARQALSRLGQPAAGPTDDVAPPAQSAPSAAVAPTETPPASPTPSRSIVVGLLALVGFVGYIGLCFTSLTRVRQVLAVTVIGLTWWLAAAWLRLPTDTLAACYLLLILPPLAGAETYRKCIALPLERFEPQAPPPDAAWQVSGKSCGNCGRPVPLSSGVGGRCPHCGAYWGSENQRRQQELTPEERRRRHAGGMAALAWLGMLVVGFIAFGASLP